MPNSERTWSDFQYDVSKKQLEALLAIALAKDTPLETLLVEAIDQYIEREKKR
jgi:hypothetical protein